MNSAAGQLSYPGLIRNEYVVTPTGPIQSNNPALMNNPSYMMGGVVGGGGVRGVVVGGGGGGGPPELINNDIALPEGWEKSQDPTGRVYFIDHINKTTSWEDPRKVLRQPTGIPGPLLAQSVPVVLSQQMSPMLSQPIPGGGTSLSPHLLAPSAVPGGGGPQQLFVPQVVGPGYLPIGGGVPMVPLQGPLPSPATMGGPARVVAGPQTSPTSPITAVPGGAFPTSSPTTAVGGGGYPGRSYPLNTQHLQTGRMNTNMVTSIPKLTTLALSPPVYAPQEGANCVSCSAEFSFLKRKHHCRCCTREFCDDCSTHKSDIKTMKLLTARVCDFCFNHLERKEDSCLSRLVPYLLEQNEERKATALGEISGLLGNPKNVEQLPAIKLLPSLMSVVSFDCTPQSKLRALAIMALLASKNVSLIELLKRDNNALAIINNLSSSSDVNLRMETARCLAFISMQGQNKQILISSGVIDPLMKELSSASSSDEYRVWLAMALYYLAASSQEDQSSIFSIPSLYPLIRLLQSPEPKLLKFITGILEIITLNQTNKQQVYENGGIECLLRLLFHTDNQIKINSLGTLICLSSHDGSRNAMVHQRGIKTVVELIESTTEEPLQEKGLTLISNLSSAQYEISVILQDLVSIIPFIAAHVAQTPNPRIKKKVLELLLLLSNSEGVSQKITESNVLLAVTSLLSSDQENMSMCLHIIGNLSHSDSNIKALIECGALMTTVELLGSQNQQTQLEASRALTALSSNPKVVKFLPEVGGLQVLFNLLHTQNVEIQENVAHILENLATDTLCAEILLNCEEIENITKFLLQPNPSLQQHAAQLVYNLANEKDQQQQGGGEGGSGGGSGRGGAGAAAGHHADLLGRVQGLLVALLSLLSSNLQAVKEKACLALVSCCLTSSYNREIIYNTPGGLHSLVLLLSSKDIKIKLAGSEVISVFSQEPKFRVGLRELGCLNTVVENLFIRNENIQKYSALTISNIVLSEKDAEIIYSLGGVTNLVSLLNSTNIDVLSMVCVAITNLAHSPVCRQALIEAGAIGSLLQMLYRDEQAQFQAVTALSILSADRQVASILPQHNGLMVLVRLLSSSNADIRTHVVHVVMNVCGDNPQNWKALISDGGIPTLVALAYSTIEDAQRKAVNELAQLSVETQYHRTIIDGGCITMLVSLLQPNPVHTIDSSIQIEAILIIANVSQDVQCLDTVLKQNGVKPIVSFLSLDYGESASFSAGRILGNMVRIMSDQEKNLAITRIYEAGAVPLLVHLLFFAQNPELTYNVLSVLVSLSSIPETVAGLVELGSISGFVQLLSAQVDERIRDQAVMMLQLMAKQPQCRSEILKNSPCMNTLLAAAADKNSRTAILEIFEGLSEQDSKFSASLEKAQIVYFLQILISELLTPYTSTQKMVVLNLLTNLSRSSNIVRTLMVEQNIISTLQSLMSDSSIIVELTTIIGNLAILTQAKTQIKETGILDLLLNLLISVHTTTTTDSTVSTVSSTTTSTTTTRTEPVFDLLQLDNQKPLPPPLVNLEQPKAQHLKEKLIGALVTLSFSVSCRETIHGNSQALAIFCDIVASSSKEREHKQLETELLYNDLALIENLLFDAYCREYFHTHQISRHLFSLLSSSSSQKLTSQILSLIEKLTVDERNDDIVRDYGMIPLVSSMAHPNEYVVTQALLIIMNLTRFDASREMVRTYVDLAVLEELKERTNDTIKQLAQNVNQVLGL